MRGMNQMMVVGALTRDPELRYTPGGSAVLEYTVSGERLEARGGEVKQVAFYLTMITPGKAGEVLAERLQQGTAVLVSGTLIQERWDDPQGGGKRSRVKGKALRVEEIAGDFELVQDAGGGVRLKGGQALVTLGGNLTRDPEPRHAPSGDLVVSFSIAVNETWTDRQNQVQEKTHYFDVEVWREQAESFLATQPKKGQPVFVEGAPQSEAWTDREGNKRNGIKICATQVLLLKGGNGQAREGAPARQPQRQAAAVGAARGGRPTQPAPRSGGLDIDQGMDQTPPEMEDLPF